jgi:hypothetical protein
VGEVLRPLIAGLASALATGLVAELVTVLATGLLDWLVALPRVVPTAAMDAEADPELPFRPRSILAATWVVGALRAVVGLVTELVACLETEPVLALKEGATEAMVGVVATGLPIRSCSTLNAVLPRPVVPPGLEKEVASAAVTAA